MTDASKLTGTWELKNITGASVEFTDLYPVKKPYITFDVDNSRVAGNTGCNSFTGKLNVHAEKISFTDPMAMTKMVCVDGRGESAFMEVLTKVNEWSISDDTLLGFKTGDIATMTFVKK